MSKETFSITLTQDQFNTLAGKLKDMGMGPESLESGTLPEKSGVVLSYTVAISNMIPTVTFTVEKKPFLVTLGMIKDHVNDLINQHG